VDGEVYEIAGPWSCRVGSIAGSIRCGGIGRPYRDWYGAVLIGGTVGRPVGRRGQVDRGWGGTNLPVPGIHAECPEGTGGVVGLTYYRSVGYDVCVRPIIALTRNRPCSAICLGATKGQHGCVWPHGLDGGRLMDDGCGGTGDSASSDFQVLPWILGTTSSHVSPPCAFSAGIVGLPRRSGPKDVGIGWSVGSTKLPVPSYEIACPFLISGPPTELTCARQALSRGR
jgi:hypothetical protein